MFKCQCRMRPVCCLLFTLNNILSSQKRKKQSKKQPRTLAVLESETMSFSPWHISSKPQSVHAWFLLLWFSVLGLHVFYSRWVSVSFTASVKHAIMLLNILNVPKHGHSFAKQALFGQRSSHFWGLECSSSCSYLSAAVILSAWRMSLQPDTKHACRVWCHKQEVIEACKSPSSLPLLELLWSFPYTLFTF